MIFMCDLYISGRYRKRKCLLVNRSVLPRARMANILSWSLIWFEIVDDCAGNALAIEASKNAVFIKFISRFFRWTYLWTFWLIFSFLLTENLTVSYIWSIYLSRVRTAVRFLHDLGEDFGNEKIRLGHVSSIYGFFFNMYFIMMMYNVWSEIGNSTRIYSLNC